MEFGAHNVVSVSTEQQQMLLVLEIPQSHSLVITGTQDQWVSVMEGDSSNVISMSFKFSDSATLVVIV